jgi:hypothetical protein
VLTLGLCTKSNGSDFDVLDDKTKVLVPPGIFVVAQQNFDLSDSVMWLDIDLFFQHEVVPLVLDYWKS